jgi:hypothetical protein
MSLWKRLFGGGGGDKPKQAPQPRRSGKSLEDIRAELEANRVTLDKARASMPRHRLRRPTTGSLWEPVYRAGRKEDVKPTELTRPEAVCLLVGAAALHFDGDGLDNGLLGNFGEPELADALPAIKEIGGQQIAAILQQVLNDLDRLRELPTEEYFKKMEAYEEDLRDAGISTLLTKLDAYLAKTYAWG